MSLGSPTAKLGEWFNTACFTAPRQIGASATSRAWIFSLRQQGINNFDLAVFKKTDIGENGATRIPHRILQPVQPSTVRTSERHLLLRARQASEGDQSQVGNPQRV